jgi:MYXO-CTERM domain-containing protein
MRCAARTIVLALIPLALALAETAAAEIVTETYSYDAAGRLRGTAFGATGQSYTYDAAGNLLARSAPEPGVAAAGFAAVALLGLLARRRRAVAAAAGLALCAAVAPADAHDCLAIDPIEMAVGQTLDDVFAINADFEEDVSHYTWCR